MRNWKKRMVLLMTAVLVLTSVSELSVYAARGDESGTEVTGGEFTEDVLDNDYLATPDLVINTCDELSSFSANVSRGITYEGKLVRLGADIAFDGVTMNNFTTIGSGSKNGFEGTFDGAGHTISGIVQTMGNSYIGLFKEVGSKGVVKNLTLKNCSFQTTYAGSYGMVCTNNGVIRNCKVENSTFKSYNHNNYDYLGAVVGENYGTIDNCRNIAAEVYAFYCAGGIAGYNEGRIMNCWSSGKVTVCSYYDGRYKESEVGGIVGESSGELNDKATIVNCGNVGSISASSNNSSYPKCLGGIVGVAYGTSIQNSYSVGEISSTDRKDDVYAGGLIGYVDYGCVVSNCYYSLDRTGAAYGETDSKPTELSVLAQTDNYMKSAAFLALLNNNREADAGWLPWTFMNDSVYPRHVPVYLVDTANVEYGTISCYTDSACAGNTVAFWINPYKYYRVTGVSVKTRGGQNVAVSAYGSGYTFVMPASDVTISATFAFSMPIADCYCSLSSYYYTYDGNAKTPSVTVNNGAATLRNGTHYTVSYSSNKDAGTGVVTITGMGNYTGTKTIYFTIYKADQEISGGAATYEKTLGAKSFSLNTKLKSGPGKLSYKSSNKKIAAVSSTGKVTLKGSGCARITVTAKGSKNFNKAEKICTIIVKPKKTTLTGVKSLKGKQLQVTWKKDSSVSGYMIEYATGSTFRNSGKIYITGGNKTSGVIRGLTATKKYYVRVYTYKTATVNGVKKNLLSTPSNVVLSNKVKR